MTAAVLQFVYNERVCHLRGELNRDTLGTLWSQCDKIFNQIEYIELSLLKRIDSTGLALLVYLSGKAAKLNKTLYFSGMSQQLRSLIKLYHLEQIIHDKTPA